MKRVMFWITRIFIVLVILFFGARGVFSIVNSPTEKRVNDTLTSAKSEFEAITHETIQVQNLAELIAMEWLTYSQADATYSKRINAFGFPVEIESTSLTASSIAKSAKAYDIEKVTDTQFNVSVQVLVSYEDLGTTEMMSLCIPIYYDKTIVRLDGIPMIQNSLNIESSKPTAISNKTLDDKELAQEIALQIDNFLKTYYEGSQSQLSVYLTDSSSQAILALEGRVSLSASSTAINVYSLSGGQYLGLVTAKITDKNGVELTQKMNIVLEKRDGKYLVVSLSPRIQNINEHFNTQEDE